MFKNILIIGCGLIGSSILKDSISKKISKNIYVFEKSKKNISFIKKIDKKIKFLKKIDHQVSEMDLIVLCIHMSQYDDIIKKLQKYVSLKDTIKGFQAIVNGDYDDLPEQAFYMIGEIKEAKKKADEL